MNYTVLVTGGTGYIGSWVVKNLLERGYNVRLTTRNKNNLSKIQFLVNYAESSKGKLEIWEADLLKMGSFDEVVMECDYVIHMASPFQTKIKNVQKELIEPALIGTSNVLRAVNLSTSVKKVVMTSSVAAVFGDNIDMKNLNLSEFDENQFNTTSSIKHQPYAYSKLLAEKEAWKIYESQQRWQLITINPSFVMGPPLSKYADSGSIILMKEFLKGSYCFGVPNLEFGFVDVRDIAKVHIQAMEDINAKGRYIISERVASLLNFAKIIQIEFKNKYQLPKKEAPKLLLYLFAPIFNLTRQFVEKNVGYSIKINSQKVINDFNLQLTPLEKTLKDMIIEMEELKML